MSTDDIKTYFSIAASLTVLLTFVGISLKPVRNIVSKWLGELFTSDIKGDMNRGFLTLTQEFTKDRALNTRRHRENKKTNQKIITAVEIVNNRLDDHLDNNHTGRHNG